MTVYAILRIVSNWIQIAKYERGGLFAAPHMITVVGSGDPLAPAEEIREAVREYLQEKGVS